MANRSVGGVMKFVMMGFVKLFMMEEMKIKAKLKSPKDTTPSTPRKM